jgi:hypothetical protein
LGKRSSKNCACPSETIEQKEGKMANRQNYGSYYYAYYGGQDAWTCDLCGQRITGTANVEDSGMSLCTHCQFRWNMLDEGLTKDCISKFALGNVC